MLCRLRLKPEDKQWAEILRGGTTFWKRKIVEDE